MPTFPSEEAWQAAVDASLAELVTAATRARVLAEEAALGAADAERHYQLVYDTIVNARIQAESD